jgi:penicillin-binding protein 2
VLNDFLDFLNEIKEKAGQSRLVILGVCYALLVCVLISRLYSLQIIHGEEYLENYIQMTEKTVNTKASRGRIYDKNGYLLAYNTLSYDVVLQDNGQYATSNLKNRMLLRLVRIIHKYGEEVEGDLKIRLNENGKFEFSTTSESSRRAFLRDIYGLRSTDLLDSEEKYSSRIGADELLEQQAARFGVSNMKDDDDNPITLTDEELLAITNIRYTLSLTAYRKYENTTIVSDVSEDCRIAVLENAGDLLGVDVVESSKRIYNDPIYFASIIGFTGKIQSDQLTELQTKDPDYTINDIVGRGGIEEYMEYELHGKKGSKSMYVDNVGHILETISETEAVAGEDIYLTIDRDLQVGIYHLLEQQLAGVLVSKIVNEDDPNKNISDASSLLISINDVYYQLINNNVLDMDHFASEDASQIEKEIYSKYLNYRSDTMETIRQQLTREDALPMNELPYDINQLMIYIYNCLVEQNIVMPDLIDTTKDYYQGWKNDTISLREYLYAGIADNWLDSSVLDVSERYSDADDIFMALMDRIDEILEDNKGYMKINYKYMIKNKVVTGRELCMALLAQGVLEYDTEEYDELSSHGEDYAFDYIISKIASIELTPAQLALDPCTAGCVVTDTTTGEVRALVSYPGYDNNKLANNMNVAYYNTLIEDQSLPLYNNATQAKKAPGSTFKPITAVAALEENAVGIDEEITCTGIYTDINPPIRCWIYPSAHGALNVEGGIMNSCNYYFSELGHRMATDEDGSYSSDRGMEIIRKYAAYFGLDHKSGVEISETEPIISSESPEQSAMGQGTHSFANVQLSRYVTTIANRGTVYELSILDKACDSEGNLIEDYTPSVYSHLDIADSTWDAVQSGMHKVISDGSASRIFSNMEVSIAGKTGTAQESKTRGNHAFFVSFAPYDDPQIAVTVNIPFGYSSSNAASVAKQVYRFYFGYLDLDKILSNTATNVYNVTIGD